jgi:hypothetical protein
VSKFTDSHFENQRKSTAKDRLNRIRRMRRRGARKLIGENDNMVARMVAAILKSLELLSSFSVGNNLAGVTTAREKEKRDNLNSGKNLEKE